MNACVLHVAIWQTRIDIHIENVYLKTQDSEVGHFGYRMYIVQCTYFTN